MALCNNGISGSEMLQKGILIEMFSVACLSPYEHIRNVVIASFAKLGTNSNCPHEYRIVKGPMNGASYHVCKRCKRKIKSPQEGFHRCDICDINVCSSCYFLRFKISNHLSSDDVVLPKSNKKIK